MMVDAIGKQMAAHGGLGLAEPVFKAMLRAQEQQVMSTDLITAGGDLAELLAAENAALAALDLPRAVGMLADKQRGVAENFVAAQRTPIAPAQRDAAERMARRLQALAMENRRISRAPWRRKAA